ncbi:MULTISPECIES: hypothetical protein [Thermoactinomyces]|jgi:NAD-dependent SIR2 family protein deacetylase|uniref:Uncharacterized protein n=1 Tax=Thermoactinomyces daqus TaxID=1329516 RepID=A0A7W2AIU9_9BACL|nr:MULTISPECIES: hypothetical protein [Thermoactinomyces]MBA4544126.1 hypothetical protein [Thermoactinomyces daqus]MBH8599513.1 hypothetical protein [Thermoactinomyces sp. CICC 10523]MBH8605432.1 hypothetical protein [Thermoactinomyces sp. CICC 10522]MBH8608974.1 hypothetical protein [Thermoactinomyces sp. CICC 10521]
MEKRKRRIREKAKQIHDQLKKKANLEEIYHTKSYCEQCENQVWPWEIHVVEQPDGTEMWACQACVREHNFPLSEKEHALEFEARRMAAKWLFLRA